MTDYAKPDSLPFRSYYAQQRRKKRKAANALVQRYITSLSAAGGMYYELSEPVVLPTLVEFSFVTNSDAAQGLLYDEDSKYVRIFSGSLRSLRDVTLNFGSGLDDGSVHHIELYFDGAQTHAHIDGQLSASVGGNAIPDVRSMGRYQSGYLSGEIYDLKIWTGGDRNTGTLVVDMPIDEDWTRETVVHNRAADLGSNIWNGVTSLQKSVNTVIAASTGGVKYLVTPSGLSPNSDLRIYTTDGLIPFPKNGSLIASEDNSTMTVVDFGESQSGISFTIQEIPAGYPFATAINVTENEAEKFTLVDGGANWLGSNENAVAYGQSITTWTGNENNYSAKSIRTDQSLVLFRETLDLSEGTAGALKIQSSASGTTPFLETGGVYIKDVVHGGSNTFVQTAADDERYVGVAKASLKRLIPIAGGA